MTFFEIYWYPVFIAVIVVLVYHNMMKMSLKTKLKSALSAPKSYKSLIDEAPAQLRDKKVDEAMSVLQTMDIQAVLDAVKNKRKNEETV